MSISFLKGCVYHYWTVVVHKFWVLLFLLKFCKKLLMRGLLHDFSKFGYCETYYFAKHVAKLKGLVYNSPEYKACLKELMPALTHHYKVNSHHPDHYPEYLKNMSSLDLTEMCADWLASVRRTKDGNIDKSINENQKRWNFTDDDKTWIRKIVAEML